MLNKQVREKGWCACVCVCVGRGGERDGGGVGGWVGWGGSGERAAEVWLRCE